GCPDRACGRNRRRRVEESADRTAAVLLQMWTSKSLLPSLAPVLEFRLKAELQKRYCIICKCSTIGPNARAGIKVKAPTIITVATSNITNKGVCVGSVPALVGVIFFR